MASRNGRLSMSPTVPPISTITMSTSLRDRADAVLDLVGDVRDHLHGAPEILAAALLLDDRLVDLARRPVVVPRRHHAGEALVVPEIQVGLGAVVGDEHLAVLVRAHRARIDVDVRVELLQRDAVAVALEQRADGCGGEALAERRHDAAGDEDVLDRPRVVGVHRHHPPAVSSACQRVSSYSARSPERARVRPARAPVRRSSGVSTPIESKLRLNGQRRGSRARARAAAPAAPPVRAASAAARRASAGTRGGRRTGRCA